MDGLTETLTQFGVTITAAAGNIWIWVENFLVLIVLTVVTLFLAMRRGGAGLISLNLALYAGYAIYIVFPYRESVIGIGATPEVQAIISVVLFVLATAIPFIVCFRLTEPSFGSLNLVQGTILSLASSVFLMALVYHTFDISNIYHFPEPLSSLFEPQGYFFYWFIAPLIGLFFLAR